MSSSLGSGQVQYHEDRPVIHFASSPEQIEQALIASRLRSAGFEPAERIPS